MRIVMFYHSLLSDWNHGNAHFLRGVTRELLHRGHRVDVYEPKNNWSLQNLRADQGAAPLRDFHTVYPELRSRSYSLDSLDLPRLLESADLVLVHEWSDHKLVRRIGQLRRSMNSFVLLFHDTHHRAVTDASSMRAYDLSRYDGVLAFGNVLRDLYIRRKWTRRAFTWHEAADTRLFRPIAGRPCEGDLIWVGNWGDDERTAELHEFLLHPVKNLQLKARIHGVRYPDSALKALKSARIRYAGWLPNYKAPDLFARFKVTVHVPRRPYVQALPGIPTIRVFEALACGIPLICSPWNDAEHLFDPGRDFLVASTGQEMTAQLRRVLHEPELAYHLAAHGHRTLISRHTCAHRVDELLNIYHELTASIAHRKKPARSRRPTARKNPSPPPLTPSTH
ncbi:MAG TPA: glycosyltransferase [Phycisphaerae bacterium]|nr:glycosyltransferase [Phycisphaerae bacterium]